MIPVQRRDIVVGAVLIAILVIGGIWLWGELEDYINPGGLATDRKDFVHVFVLSAAAAIGTLTAIAAVGNFVVSHRNLEQQRDLDEQRAQDDAFQSYFNQMGGLLTDNNLMETEHTNDPIRLLARAKTMTVLEGLDPTNDRAMRNKRDLIFFLYGAGLIHKEEPIVELAGADLSGAHLHGARLNNAGLIRANLFNANLRGAYLVNSYLSFANLNSADLSGAYLVSADLIGAKLIGAKLMGAELRDANLISADLRGADISGASLSGASLSGAAVTEEQLSSSESLEGATMPNDQKYEDWLKTTAGLNWLRKHKKDLGEHKKRAGEYERWIHTTEGQMWLRAVEEDLDNADPS
jgi:uncharacterized protein YjbI with pentapeptide repeats